MLRSLLQKWLGPSVSNADGIRPDENLDDLLPDVGSGNPSGTATVQLIVSPSAAFDFRVSTPVVCRMKDRDRLYRTYWNVEEVCCRLGSRVYLETQGKNGGEGQRSERFRQIQGEEKVLS